MNLRHWWLLAALSACAGCLPASRPIVHQPMTARPAPPQEVAAGNGAIFGTGNYRPLFEDRRARHVGDTLVVQIAEKTAANKNAASSADKSGAVSYGVTALKGLPGKSFLGSELDANSSHTFEGKGAATASNDFTGTIAVTIIEVLPNGNLVVSGEKQIAMAQGTEYVRFSGVVSPNTIGPQNTVSSVQVADARLEYKADGYINSAQVMGWLARFFLTFLPF